MAVYAHMHTHTRGTGFESTFLHALLGPTSTRAMIYARAARLWISLSSSRRLHLCFARERARAAACLSR